MKLFAIEFLLITVLALLAMYVLWDSVSRRALLGLASVICVGIYWLLHFRGRSRMAFRVAAILSLLPHVTVMWAHNSLEWYRFLGIETSFVASRSQLWSTAMFLLCLSGLVALYRVVGLRSLDRELSSRGVYDSDRRAVIINEGLTLAALIGAGLMLALITAQVGSMLGGIESVPDLLSSAVLPIGGGAAILFAYCVALWFRYRGETVDAGASPGEHHSAADTDA